MTQLRRNKGLTQEELAEGVCAVSTLSRIENGSMAPSREIFEVLMERLDVSGMFYEDYFSEASLELLKLRNEIMECMEYDRIAEAGDRLWEYKGLCRETGGSDILHEQFIRFAEMLYTLNGELKNKEILRDSLKILHMTRPDFQTEAECLFHSSYTSVETCLINALAIYEMWSGRSYEAIRLLLSLFFRNEGSRGYSSALYWKREAVLCNNLALVELEAGNVSGAQVHLDAAFRCIGRAGGVMLLLKIYRTRRILHQRCQDTRSQLEDSFEIGRMYRYMPREVRQGRSCDEFLRARPEVFIL